MAFISVQANIHSMETKTSNSGKEYGIINLKEYKGRGKPSTFWRIMTSAEAVNRYRGWGWGEGTSVTARGDFGVEDETSQPRTYAKNDGTTGVNLEIKWASISKNPNDFSKEGGSDYSDGFSGDFDNSDDDDVWG